MYNTKGLKIRENSSLAVYSAHPDTGSNPVFSTKNYSMVTLSKRITEVTESGEEFRYSIKCVLSDGSSCGESHCYEWAFLPPGGDAQQVKSDVIARCEEAMDKSLEKFLTKQNNG